MGMRVEFDSLIEEFVDVQIRFVNHTKVYRRQRSRQRRWLALGVAAGVPIVFLNQVHRVTTAAIAVALGVGIMLGGLGGWLYGYYVDWHLRHHTRRMIEEMFRGATTARCEIELRPDVIWVKSRDTEISLSWTRLTAI